MNQNPESYDSTGDLAGLARPTAHLRQPLQVLQGEGSRIPLELAMSEALGIEVLAAALTASMPKAVAPNGDINFRLLAAHAIKHLRGEAG
jgi:hypothetical protein